MHEKNKLENSLATDEKKQRSLWQEAWHASAKSDGDDRSRVYRVPCPRVHSNVGD